VSSASFDVVSEIPTKHIGVYVMKETVTKTKLPLFTDNGFLIYIKRKPRSKKYQAIIKIASKGRDPPCYLFFSSIEEFAEGVKQMCNNLDFAPFAESLAKAVFQYIEKWDWLALEREIEEAYSLTSRNLGSFVNKPETVSSTAGPAMSCSWKHLKNGVIARLLETIKELKSIQFLTS
jgi:hypothetical protein